MISKEIFVKILNQLKELRTKWDRLQEAAEDLSDGTYVNFWPHLQYEEMIENLLNDEFGYNMSKDYAWSPISTFMVEGNFGEDAEWLIDADFDISTPEKLYDYCVENAKLSRE